MTPAPEERVLLGLCADHEAEAVAAVGCAALPSVASTVVWETFQEVDLLPYGDDPLALARDIKNRYGGCPVCFLKASGVYVLRESIARVKAHFGL